MKVETIINGRPNIITWGWEIIFTYNFTRFNVVGFIIKAALISFAIASTIVLLEVLLTSMAI